MEYNSVIWSDIVERALHNAVEEFSKSMTLKPEDLIKTDTVPSSDESKLDIKVEEFNEKEPIVEHETKTHDIHYVELNDESKDAVKEVDDVKSDDKESVFRLLKTTTLVNEELKKRVKLMDSQFTPSGNEEFKESNVNPTSSDESVSSTTTDEITVTNETSNEEVKSDTTLCSDEPLSVSNDINIEGPKTDAVLSSNEVKINEPKLDNSDNIDKKVEVKCDITHESNASKPSSIKFRYVKALPNGIQLSCTEMDQPIQDSVIYQNHIDSTIEYDTSPKGYSRVVGIVTTTGHYKDVVTFDVVSGIVKFNPESLISGRITEIGDYVIDDYGQKMCIKSISRIIDPIVIGQVVAVINNKVYVRVF